MSEPITAALLGAGLRGAFAYGPYAGLYPDQLKFVAVAEPDDARRALFAGAHDIPPERQFRTWEDLLARPQLADTLFNMTQDQMHYASTLAALAAGYDVLLEKPITHDLAQTVRLVSIAEQSGRFLQICHVLRYTPFFQTLHEILQSGRLGQIVNVSHRENVVYWHMAHSYVRGNWRSVAASAPMVLAKCCHDFDILHWNLPSPVRRLQSFGTLTHFRPQNAPPGATARCTDGCPAGDICPFDARRIYLDPHKMGWPVLAVTTDLSMEARRRALEEGPYGRCVYRSDNDVVDHQTVNMELDDGTTITLTMHGHSHEEGRTMRYDGTRATLRAKFGEQSHIEIHDHLTGEVEAVEIAAPASGHGGGDFGIVEGFVRAVRGEAPPLTTAREALESHLLAFAAEQSRLMGSVVDMAEFRARAAGYAGSAK